MIRPTNGDAQSSPPADASSGADYDAVIIGGGPAGATAGAILAQHGRRVVILEKDRFPRYHVGESLLPFCYFTLERLGMLPQLKSSSFVKKYSVQFVSMDGRQSAPFYFNQHLQDHPAGQTWQVVRSEFDQMLLDNARRLGAHVREETKVRSFIMEGDAVAGVHATDKAGRELAFRAPITIDASGRDMFAIKQRDWRVNDPYLNKIAIWTYYQGAKRDPGIDEGATTVAYIPEKGWFWYIPLPGDKVSVGVVGEKDYLYRDGKDPERIMAREIAANAWLVDHLAPGRQCGEYWATGDYSYRSRHSAADGLVLTGDAFAFLDPVFSSGVFLALKGGELAADAAHEALLAGDVSARRFADYSETVIAGVEAMRALVYGFYDASFSFGAMLKKYPDIRGDLTDCLIGNVDKDLGPLFDAVREFAENVPQPLPHGRPLVTTPDSATA